MRKLIAVVVILGLVALPLTGLAAEPTGEAVEPWALELAKAFNRAVTSRISIELDTVMQPVKESLANIDQRVSGMEASLASFQENLNSRLDGIQEEQNSIKSAVHETRQQIADVQEDYTAFQTKTEKGYRSLRIQSILLWLGVLVGIGLHFVPLGQ